MARSKYEGMPPAISVPVSDHLLPIVSVHVNWPGGVQGATWPSHDPTGYTEAEKSMCAYGRANFSK